MVEPGRSGEHRRATRRHPRARLVTQVEATTLGRTENISVGGVLVLTRETFQPGTEVTVRFTLPPDQFISATGVIVHTTPAVSMGIHFTGLKDGDRKAIESYVKQTAEENRASP